jgi:hypothetical protein
MSKMRILGTGPVARVSSDGPIVQNQVNARRGAMPPPAKHTLGIRIVHNADDIPLSGGDVITQRRDGGIDVLS